MVINHDLETGEATETRLTLNRETGEMEKTERALRRPFQIPLKCCKNKENKKASGSKKLPQNKSQNSPVELVAILFLLPTTILFYPSVLFVYFAIEAIVHTWVHKKNKKLQNTNVRYISPLHIIASEFCAICREEESSIKISEFQKRAADRFRKYGLDYVRKMRIVT